MQQENLTSPRENVSVLAAGGPLFLAHGLTGAAREPDAPRTPMLAALPVPAAVALMGPLLTPGSDDWPVPKR